jgi:hypothetical protein
MTSSGFSKHSVAAFLIWESRSYGAPLPSALRATSSFVAGKSVPFRYWLSVLTAKLPRSMPIDLLWGIPHHLWGVLPMRPEAETPRPSLVPECVEEAFCELRLDQVLRSSHSPSPTLKAFLADWTGAMALRCYRASSRSFSVLRSALTWRSTARL